MQCTTQTCLDDFGGTFQPYDTRSVLGTALVLTSNDPIITSPVPEPATWTLLLAGVAGMLMIELVRRNHFKAV